MSALKKEYGDKVKLTKDYDDQLVDVFQTDWYSRIRKTLTPGGIWRSIVKTWD